MIAGDSAEFLLNAAAEAIGHAYVPYSKFKVGAALLAENGTVYKGANIENSSYSLTICAERVAMSKAVFDGNTKWSAICIYHDGAELPVPCGSCLQFMSEFSKDMHIIVLSNEHQVEYTLDQLLPVRFTL